MLDLRDNGGGLLNEALLVASHVHPRGHDRHHARPRAARARRSRRPAARSTAKIPVVVLVNRGTASASEIVTGALQDRDRAEVVGTRTFGKGVFQEVEPLSNGGALDITVGEYFTPNGRNLGGGGVKQGEGIAPDVEAERRPARPSRDEALDKALATVAAGRAREHDALSAAPQPGRGGAREARALPHRDAVLRARAAHQPRQPRRATRAPATSCWSRRPARAAGTRKVVRRLGRPDVRARRARGADARPRAAAALRPRGRARGARRRASRGADAGAAARPARPAHVHDRPADRARTSTTRSPPRGSTTARSASGCTSPTSARYVRPGLARRPRGLPPRHERLRPRRGRADAAGGAVQRGLLARARRRTASR